MGFPAQIAVGNEIKNLVWYHIEMDMIFQSPEVDAMFYCLYSYSWSDLILLGEL